MDANYFFFDGSALVAQIRQLQRSQRKFAGHKLDPLKLVEHFSGLRLRQLHAGSFKRAVFYFPRNDPQIKEHLLLPELAQPALIRDVAIKYCGSLIKGGAAYRRFLASVPKRFRDKCAKAEKGVDVEMCCDALALAATGRLDRLFLLTNDSDFVPLCHKLKEFGCNVSLLRLSNAGEVNRELLAACDSYDVVLEPLLDDLFGVKKEG